MRVFCKYCNKELVTSPSREQVRFDEPCIAVESCDCNCECQIETIQKRLEDFWKKHEQVFKKNPELDQEIRMIIEGLG